MISAFWVILNTSTSFRARSKPRNSLHRLGAIAVFLEQSDNLCQVLSNQYLMLEFQKNFCWFSFLENGCDDDCDSGQHPLKQLWASWNHCSEVFLIFLPSLFFFSFGDTPLSFFHIFSLFDCEFIKRKWYYTTRWSILNTKCWS